MFAVIFVILTGLSSAVTTQEANTQEPRDVEIDVGGNIKLENPDRSKLEEIFEWHAHLSVVYGVGLKNTELKLKGVDWIYFRLR